MTDPHNPSEHLWSRPPIRRVLAVLLPVLFLVAAWTALLYKRGAFTLHTGSRVRLSQEESKGLADASKSAFDQGHYTDALKPTLTLYGAYPDNHIYIGRLADIYDRLGRYDEEASYWERYLDHAPTPIEACPHLGQAYWKQGDKFEPQAIAAYRRCLALDPKNTDSTFYLAHALEMSGQWAQAAEEYRRGLSISPGYTDLTLGLARCWLHMDKPDDARDLIDPILHRHVVSSDALLVLGMYYLNKKNYPAAKKVLSRGAQLSESDPDFHALLARTAEQMNDNEEALRQYSKVVKLKPEDAGARSRRDALQAAENASN